jgi:hypothetical protein
VRRSNPAAARDTPDMGRDSGTEAYSRIKQGLAKLDMSWQESRSFVFSFVLDG